MTQASAEALERLLNLLESIAPYDISTVVLHHSSKSRAHERASNASAGRGLGRMASHVVNLHWLNPDAKEDQRVRLTTEGRSSKSVDCVIEQVDRAIWSMHGDTAQINAQLDLKRVESKLSERLSNVLTLVEQHWMLTDRPISPVEVAEEMPDEFGNNGRQKAFQALDALYRKRLLEKIKRSDGKRGTVVLFQPLKERRCS